MKNINVLTFLLCVGFGQISLAKGPEMSEVSLTLLTHNAKESTFTDRNGQMRGKLHAGRRAFNVELVHAIMQERGFIFSIKDVSFKRGLMRVQNDNDIALFNVNRSQEREKTVQWVGPLQQSTTHFYELKSAPSRVKNLADAQAVNYICVLNGNVHHRYLKDLGFDNITTNVSYSGCLEMLMHGRVSLIPLSNISVFLQHPKYQSLLQKTPVKLSDFKGYMAFSNNVSEEMVHAWQAGLDRLKASGVYEVLVQQYLFPEK